MFFFSIQVRVCIFFLGILNRPIWLKAKRNTNRFMHLYQGEFYEILPWVATTLIKKDIFSLVCSSHISWMLNWSQCSDCYVRLCQIYVLTITGGCCMLDFINLITEVIRSVFMLTLSQYNVNPVYLAPIITSISDFQKKQRFLHS